jgi:hypothetical protein
MNHNSVRYLLAAAGGGAIALLATGLSVQSVLPWLLLLACPLMMVFMMRGMNHGGQGGRDGADHRDTTDTADHRDTTDTAASADHGRVHRP